MRCLWPDCQMARGIAVPHNRDTCHAELNNAARPRYHPRMRKTLYRANTPCPCESGETYVQCCGPWHVGLDEGHFAPSAEALMRSRYSAYVLGLIDYLLATWHGSTAPGELELRPVKWLGLELRHAQESGDAGVVEFVARLRDTGRGERIHEISRFVRENSRWYYIDGQIMDENTQ